ncbi:MAG: LytR C-terminal domain-containing protein [Pseudomonadales bacterium]|nr:LytR C-terminal domain-containing protein [Pseudomonadales bacterium]
MNKSSHQIIFIYKNKLFFCHPEKKESLEFPLSSDIIKDLTIIDEAKLKKSLESFLSKTQITDNETLIILNKNTYFRTTIESPELNPENNKVIIDQFSDLVPFDDIFVKQFNLHKKLEVVAINREFYEPILSVLQKLKFNITMILPDLVVKDYIGEASCTPEENSALLKVLNKLGQYDLLGSGHILLSKTKIDLAPIKAENKRLYILVGLFAILIIMLVGVIIFNSNRTYGPPIIDKIPPELETIIETKKPSIASDSSQASNSGELSEGISSSSSALLDLDQYTLRVLNGSGISGQANVVKSDLQKAGFKNIDIGNAQKISSNKTQILLNPKLPSEVRALLLNVLENFGQEYTIQENSELNYDVVITTTSAN